MIKTYNHFIIYRPTKHNKFSQQFHDYRLIDRFSICILTYANFNFNWKMRCFNWSRYEGFWCVWFSNKINEKKNCSVSVFLLMQNMRHITKRIYHIISREKKTKQENKNYYATRNLIYTQYQGSLKPFSKNINQKKILKY